ncbi:acidic mammalian chitinase-like isoform X2 [Liolophura sinensis]|uniref:acidic mammalian chitinase-like isoform X2 n=1 Tax=Liolophura sinensis TaxID=3198878 RepID=UPI00315837A0
MARADVQIRSDHFERDPAEYRCVCYYTNWSQYRPGTGKFFPENVDPHLLTHGVYAFAKLDGNKLKAFEWNDESTPWMKGMYSRFNDLKKINPKLKTLLAVGGWNLGSAPFTAMVKTAANRKEFVTTSIEFLRKRDFDGLDIDWEYPANRGSPPEDRAHFTSLLTELRAAFEAEAKATGKPRLLLSAAVGAGQKEIDSAYDVPEISKSLDMLNLMTYDFHGAWEKFTGFNSPLYGRKDETGDQKLLNMDWAVQHWLSKGAPPEKINLGLAMYGHDFTLKNLSKSAPGDPASVGQAGKYTRQPGILSYYEIATLLDGGGQRQWCDEQKVPFAVKGNQWAGYDDEQSLKLKVAFAKKNKLGGVMVWSLDLDDFCGMGEEKTKYPLLTTVNKALQA